MKRIYVSESEMFVTSMQWSKLSYAIHWFLYIFIMGKLNDL